MAVAVATVFPLIPAVAATVYVPVGWLVPCWSVKLALNVPVEVVVAIVSYAVLPAESVTVMPTRIPEAGWLVVVSVSVPVMVACAPAA